MNSAMHVLLSADSRGNLASFRRQMVTHTALLTSIEPDGKAVSARSRKVYFDPTPPAGLTRTFLDYSFAAPSSAAYAIANTDTFMTLSQPFSALLPQALLDIIAAEPCHSGGGCVTYGKTLLEVSTGLSCAK